MKEEELYTPEDTHNTETFNFENQYLWKQIYYVEAENSLGVAVI